MTNYGDISNERIFKLKPLSTYWICKSIYTDGYGGKISL